MIGEEIISPGAKQGLVPLVIPLSRRSSGMMGMDLISSFFEVESALLCSFFPFSSFVDSVTALLRWPTAPSG